MSQRVQVPGVWPRKGPNSEQNSPLSLRSVAHFLSTGYPQLRI